MQTRQAECFNLQTRDFLRIVDFEKVASIASISSISSTAILASLELI